MPTTKKVKTRVADEPKSVKDQPNISPAPTDVAEGKPGDPAAGATPPPAPASKLPADALSDGTVPTVITPGESHHSVPKGTASLTRVYRRADIVTTLITFVSVLVALAIIGGIYYFFVARTAKKATTATPKVTTLGKDDLAKLGSFFSGNSAGGDNQVLNITSPTLFKGRVATSSDLKVAGGLDVAGPTNFGDLVVNKTATVGVLNTRGQLVVAGPSDLKGPVQMSASATVTGNINVSGNGSFGGSLSAGTINVANISVTGTINLAGHLSITGQKPTAGPASDSGAGATVQIDGNDTSGTIDVNTGSIPTTISPGGGLIATVTFHTPYPRTPRILISADGQNAGSLGYYVLKTANGFTIGSSNKAASGTQYSFDYWVVQ